MNYLKAVIIMQRLDAANYPHNRQASFREMILE